MIKEKSSKEGKQDGGFMARSKSKLIKADVEFIRKIRDAQQKIEQKYNVKISDRQATAIIAQDPHFDNLFNPIFNDDDFTERKKKKKSHPFSLI